MSKIGQLNTSKPIESAMREIRDWLQKLDVSGLNIQTNYDAKINVALVKFKYKNKDYEFRSTQQRNCRLNMHGIARVMEFKVRASLMGIEDFESSMKSYIAIENKSSFTSSQPVENEMDYVKLGVSPLASNEEIKEKYRKLCKSFHPDMALSEEAKKEFEKRFSEINEAWTSIQKDRGLITSEEHKP